MRTDLGTVSAVTVAVVDWSTALLFVADWLWEEWGILSPKGIGSKVNGGCNAGG